MKEKQQVDESHTHKDRKDEGLEIHFDRYDMWRQGENCASEHEGRDHLGEVSKLKYGK
jgi:hypothetical protein